MRDTRSGIRDTRCGIRDTRCGIRDTGLSSRILHPVSRISHPASRQGGNNITRAQSYRDLEIYQLAHKLAVEVHKMTLKLPRFEMYEEGRQIRKSSKSIPNTIVEGFGRRRYKGDFVRFLTYPASRIPYPESRSKGAP
ncbi:MAG: four helix bundle protein [Anaerolineae bacterium]